MSIHNTLFFKDPLNYLPGRVKRRGTSVIVNEMTDNRYTTASAEPDVDVDVSEGSGKPTRVDYIFIKYTGDVERYIATPTGGNILQREVPETVMNWEGGQVSLEVNGFKHDLFELPSPITATSVRMQFIGTGLQVYALMLLEVGLEIHANRDWSRILPRKVDRTGRIHQNPRGGLQRVYPIGAGREKWEYALTLLSIDGTTGLRYNDFLTWKAAHPNCAFAREFTRFPEEVMLVAFTEVASDIQPRSSRFKGAGDRVAFRVAER